MTAPPPDRIADLAGELGLLTEELLDAIPETGFAVTHDAATISRDRLYEVASFVIRDLDRISDDQDERFSLTKFCGYVAFWYAKIKPITLLRHRPAPDAPMRELLDANERMALKIARTLLLLMPLRDPALQPDLWMACTVAACTRHGPAGPAQGRCLEVKHALFLQALDGKFRKYVEYGLRHRSISPYFLVHSLDQAVALSCEGLCPSIQGEAPGV